MSKPFKRELKRSVLDSYINGNINSIPEDIRILCMVHCNDLEIEIIEDVCYDCGEDIYDCTCGEDEEDDFAGEGEHY